jgi:hypothetical protein
VGGDLFPALKARMADTNRNLAVQVWGLGDQGGVLQPGYKLAGTPEGAELG